MDIDLVNILETMAANGVAPQVGCSLFGIGYEAAFSRLKKVYLLDRLAQRGGSAEKFVVGPYGSGKTHFLRQLMEIARGEGFVTAEIILDRDIDYTNRLMVYREMVRNIRFPGNEGHGMRGLLKACIENVKGGFSEPQAADGAFQKWVNGLDEADFQLEDFARVVQKAIRYDDLGDEDLFKSACQWLSGGFDDRRLARELRVVAVSKAEMNLFAGRAMFSLFQFIRYADFNGTVVCYDEADIGFQVDRKKLQAIVALLRADIGLINDLDGGAVLIVYALTDSVLKSIDQYMALKQRIFSQPGHSFLAGNNYAAMIDLSYPTDRRHELKAMGYRLTDLLYEREGYRISLDKDVVIRRLEQISEDIIEEDISSSSRREMAKRASVLLLNVLNKGLIDFPTKIELAVEEDEV